jgi:hypothetical protein
MGVAHRWYMAPFQGCSGAERFCKKKSLFYKMIYFYNIPEMIGFPYLIVIPCNRVNALKGQNAPAMGSAHRQKGSQEMSPEWAK